MISAVICLAEGVLSINILNQINRKCKNQSILIICLISVRDPAKFFRNKSYENVASEVSTPVHLKFSLNLTEHLCFYLE